MAGLCVAVSWVSQRLLASETPQTDALAALRQEWREEHATIANQRLIASIGIEKPEELFDPDVNSGEASRLFRRAGWKSWGPQP
ncbi:MAG: hypothetical protein WBN89_07795 [Prochlorococcaceae cyanobacterium]